MKCRCLDNTCSYSDVMYADRGSLFRHYYSKTRERLIGIVIQYKLLQDPYHESKISLIRLLVKNSQVVT